MLPYRHRDVAICALAGAPPRSVFITASLAILKTSQMHIVAFILQTISFFFFFFGRLK